MRKQSWKVHHRLHDSWVLRNTWQPMPNYGNFFIMLIKKRCMMTCSPIYCTFMPVFLQSFYFIKLVCKISSKTFSCCGLSKNTPLLLILMFTICWFSQFPMPHFFSELYSEYHRQLLSSFGCHKSGGNSGEKCRCWAIPQCYFQSRSTARKPSHPPWASVALFLPE